MHLLTCLPKMSQRMASFRRSLYRLGVARDRSDAVCNSALVRSPSRRGLTARTSAISIPREVHQSRRYHNGDQNLKRAWHAEEGARNHHLSARELFREVLLQSLNHLIRRLTHPNICIFTLYFFFWNSCAEFYIRAGARGTAVLHSNRCLQAQIARMSGYCYSSIDSLTSLVQREGLRLVASGDTFFTRWYATAARCHV